MPLIVTYRLIVFSDAMEANRFCVNILLVLFVVSVWCAVFGRSGASACHIPKNLTRILKKLHRKMVIESYTTLGTMYMIRNFRRNHHFDPFPSNGRTSKKLMTRIYGEARCSEVAKIRPSDTDKLSRVSSCPWYVALHYDQNRIPSTMAHARCSCQNCLPGGAARCEPINSFVPVIRRYCPLHGEKYQYHVTLEKVPVGCTCVRNVATSSG